ncbi:MurR/RpiR family transcriptional regulator [Sphingomonas canadensis]|uniref:MurR/RpiR family transcriptional regulator n=1 Tax=Sphingomonas canadensis TaxID=1219257 RepID=A0ABW3H5J7_9SPHN|nr:MurR/RpiR family transcriptional regulator [Sphingomonas canadensis]MCW3836219.1 MurR/RpiR family transcriptional regulator [Sphingomonas canadensis]
MTARTEEALQPSPESNLSGADAAAGTSARTIVNRLNEAAVNLPPKLAAAARYVAAHPFDAASMPMRALARQTDEQPTTYTRLARSLGYSGWEALRAELIADARIDLAAAREAPFSSRPLLPSGEGTLAGRMLSTDIHNIAELDGRALDAAASVIERAGRVFVSGYRSCYAPAVHFHYLYRLFRNEVSIIGSAGGMLDLELGGLQAGDAVVLFGFAPYSRDGFLTAQAAISAGASLIAVVDSADSPLAQGAEVALLFNADSPGYFPSLSACTALIQALAGTLYIRAGAEGRERLRAAEARIAAHTAYLDPDLG